MGSLDADVGSRNMCCRHVGAEEKGKFQVMAHRSQGHFGQPLAVGVRVMRWVVCKQSESTLVPVSWGRSNVLKSE